MTSASMLLLMLMYALLLLPLKLAWWTAKGLVGLLLIVPLAILGVLIFTNVFPVLLLVLVLLLLLLLLLFSVCLSLCLCLTF